MNIPKLRCRSICRTTVVGVSLPAPPSGSLLASLCAASRRSSARLRMKAAEKLKPAAAHRPTAALLGRQGRAGR